MKEMIEFSEIARFLRKCGYSDYETKDHHRVFYEFDKLDFLYSECAKRFECDYYDGKVEKVVMTRYWFGNTYFKDIFTLEELYDSI